MYTKIAYKHLPNILCLSAVLTLQYSALGNLSSFREDITLEVPQTYRVQQRHREMMKLARIENTGKMASIGFRNIVSNYAFIQFLQYFGDDERDQLGYSDSSVFLEAALNQDPYNTDLYLFLSGSTTIYAGDPQETVDVMQTALDRIGIKRANDNYFAWRYKAVDELLFLGNSDAARKSFEKAAEWAQESDYEGAQVIGEQSQQTAEFLSKNPSSTLAQINSWGSVLTTALDEHTRQRAIENIRLLGGDVFFNENGGLHLVYPESSTNEG